MAAASTRPSLGQLFTPRSPDHRTALLCSAACRLPPAALSGRAHPFSGRVAQPVGAGAQRSQDRAEPAAVGVEK